VRAHEVPARAARDHCQLDVVAAGDALDDLVDGPVAADRDDQPRSAFGGLSRELAELTLPLGDERIARQPERGCAVRQLGPATAGRAVVGGRVDEEDGVANEAPLAVPASERAGFARALV
jgi:hypothetical protein